jgi:hypothetical protein
LDLKYTLSLTLYLKDITPLYPPFLTTYVDSLFNSPSPLVLQLNTSFSICNYIFAYVFTCWLSIFLTRLEALGRHSPCWFLWLHCLCHSTPPSVWLQIKN